MEQRDAVAYTEKCFSGEPAPCSFECPFSIDVRSLMERAAKGRWNVAYKSLRNAALFPAVVCELCPAPCETECLRKQTGDETVAITQIEEACVRFAKNKNPDRYVIPPKTEKIAIIGAGVAGLSAALCLAQKMFVVTVFDINAGWGGKLRSHPLFEQFDEDIRLQYSAVVVEFRFNAEIKSLEELSEYDVIYVATGSEGNDFGLLPGWDSELLSTDIRRVFMGGAVTGASLVDSINQGKSFSKIAEAFLQTGRVENTFDVAKGSVCRIDCSGVASAPRVLQAGADGYSEEEAKTEAARCMLCDCDMCMADCEMLSLFKKKPKKIAIEVYSDTKALPPYSTHTITRQAYSCNMCGRCRTICPEDVDIGALLQTSRAARLESGEYPEPFHDYWMREMDFSIHKASFHYAPDGGAEYVFFPGCQLGAHNPEYVLRSFESLRKKWKTGIFVNCCGAPAYWAGDNGRMGVNAEHIRHVWRETGEPTFVFACATCESVFAEFMAEIPRVSLYEMLARGGAGGDGGDVRAGTSAGGAVAVDGSGGVGVGGAGGAGAGGDASAGSANVGGDFSVFDPCNARKNPGMEAAVRELARSFGLQLHELPEKNRCCGYGGHIRLANPKLYDTITANRVNMGEHPYIVYCVNCREVFASRGKDCAHILDVIFDLPRDAGVPRIDEKRRNAMSVKRRLSKELAGVDIIENDNEWESLELNIEDELAASLDKKLISLSEVKEAIWLAEKNDDKFIDDEDGICLCSMEKPPLTYWVRYKAADNGAFEVYDAYYHRMRIMPDGE